MIIKGLDLFYNILHFQMQNVDTLYIIVCIILVFQVIFYQFTSNTEQMDTVDSLRESRKRPFSRPAFCLLVCLLISVCISNKYAKTRN